MNIYLVERPASLRADYDQYISFVVAAESKNAASLFHPQNEDTSPDFPPYTWDEVEGEWRSGSYSIGTWITPAQCVVTLIGALATEDQTPRILHTSFNAG